MHYIPLADELARDLPRYRGWLLETIERVAPSRMIVDTFPAGILGELSGLSLPSDLRLELVARALRWDRYHPLLGQAPPRFSRGYIVEALPAGQQHYLEAHCEELVTTELTDPPSDLSADELLASVGLQSGSFWLVVHSGPEHEIATLIGHALDIAMTERTTPRILLVSPRRPALTLDHPIIHLDIYPATPLFPHAARIITACGFNAMRQTLPWRDRHHCVPFPRRYDDQEERMKDEG
jgi:hypothetical protein